MSLEDKTKCFGKLKSDKRNDCHKNLQNALLSLDIKTLKKDPFNITFSEAYITYVNGLSTNKVNLFEESRYLEESARIFFVRILNLNTMVELAVFSFTKNKTSNSEELQTGNPKNGKKMLLTVKTEETKREMSTQGQGQEDHNIVGNPITILKNCCAENVNIESTILLNDNATNMSILAVDEFAAHLDSLNKNEVSLKVRKVIPIPKRDINLRSTTKRNFNTQLHAKTQIPLKKRKRLTKKFENNENRFELDSNMSILEYQSSRKTNGEILETLVKSCTEECNPLLLDIVNLRCLSKKEFKKKMNQLRGTLVQKFSKIPKVAFELPDVKDNMEKMQHMFEKNLKVDEKIVDIENYGQKILDVVVEASQKLKLSWNTKMPLTVMKSCSQDSVQLSPVDSGIGSMNSSPTTQHEYFSDLKLENDNSQLRPCEFIKDTQIPEIYHDTLMSRSKSLKSTSFVNHEDKNELEIGKMGVNGNALVSIHHIFTEMQEYSEEEASLTFYNLLNQLSSKKLRLNYEELQSDDVEKFLIGNSSSEVLQNLRLEKHTEKFTAMKSRNASFDTDNLFVSVTHTLPLQLE